VEDEYQLARIGAGDIQTSSNTPAQRSKISAKSKALLDESAKNINFNASMAKN